MNRPSDSARCWPACRHPWWLHAIPNDGYNEGHMDAVWWFNVECFHDFTAAYNGVAGSRADAHRKSDSCVMNRHLITDETKLGLVWYVRKCPWMNRAASVPNGMRNDEAKQRASRIEKPCRAWILYWMRGVWEMTCPRGRKVCWNGMMLTACPRWDMRRDDDCGFLGGTYRTGTCRRHARLHRFTSKLRLISKKMRRCHYCTVFSFFHARHTAGEEPFLKREEECRKRRFAHGSFLLRELIWKWEHIVVSVCSHRK